MVHKECVHADTSSPARTALHFCHYRSIANTRLIPILGLLFTAFTVVTTPLQHVSAATQADSPRYQDGNTVDPLSISDLDTVNQAFDFSDPSLLLATTTEDAGVFSADSEDDLVAKQPVQDDFTYDIVLEPSEKIFSDGNVQFNIKILGFDRLMYYTIDIVQGDQNLKTVKCYIYFGCVFGKNTGRIEVPKGKAGCLYFHPVGYYGSPFHIQSIAGLDVALYRHENGTIDVPTANQRCHFEELYKRKR